MDETAFHRFVEQSLAVIVGGAAEADERQAALPQDRIRFTRLAGDGSARQIFRVEREGVRVVAVSNPLPAERSHPDENESFLAVREHLDRRRVPVPRFYAADLDLGFLLLQDLGDVRLVDRIGPNPWADPDRAKPVEALYATALDLLVRMQAFGDPPFRMSLVGNPPYTEEFILEREAGYFFDEFVGGYSKAELPFSQIAEDCRRLAREAGPVPASPDQATGREPVFMHRDFQSRNLMVVGSSVTVIDFQGARLGPPEYDLAALLYDPYVEMPVDIRERLLMRYIATASRNHIPGIPESLESPDGATWRRRLLANAANRLMQALGAFAKLGWRLNRPGFLEHVGAGSRLLDSVLEERDDCPELHAIVRRLRRD